ncbi:MAG: lipocalin family protein [Bacteroidales bacterium]|nr:lipocalin family protein [Bacteroidales bacterium]
MNKKVFISLALVLCTFFSCSSYEDGPAVSLIPRKVRLVNKWKMEKKFINDQEQTLSEDEKKGYWNLKNDNTAEVVSYSGSLTYTFTGTWEEVDHYNKVRIKVSGTFLGFPVTLEDEYIILRLTNNELWVKQVKNNETYEYHLVTY